MTGKRDAIIDDLADHLLAYGLAGSSLRPLAAAAGLSDRMLLYHFENKAAVLSAGIERVADRLRTALDERVSSRPLPPDRLTALLVPIVLSDELWPFTRLWLEIVVAAAHGDAFCRETGAGITDGFLDWCARQLDGEPGSDRDHHAARALVMVEGAALLHAVGAGDVVERAIGSRR